MDIRQKPLCRVDDMDFFRQLVRSAFSKRRKTLLNSLKSSLLPVTGDQISAALSALGIDGVRRAETLSVQEFADLSNFLGKA